MDNTIITASQLQALVTEQLVMCPHATGNTLYVRLHSHVLDSAVREFLKTSRKEIVLGGDCLIYITDFCDNTVYIGIPYPHDNQ